MQLATEKNATDYVAMYIAIHYVHTYMHACTCICHGSVVAARIPYTMYCMYGLIYDLPHIARYIATYTFSCYES